MKKISKDDKGKSGIYIITNLENNKVYIGQSIDLWTRINEGYFQKLPKGKGHNIHLQRAWDKYGKKNFSFKVLEYIKDINSLNERETYWIKEYNSTNNKFGYNIQPEGGSNRGVKVSDETKRKISIATSGENNPNYGKIPSKEQKESISKSQSVAIIQLDLDGNYIREWESIKVASDYYNVFPFSLGTVLKKKTTSSCGFIWVYKEKYDEVGFNVEEHYKINQTMRQIVQLDLEGNIINEFRSAYQAIQETKIKNVTSACRGYQKTAGGYVWMYKEDFLQNGFDKDKYINKGLNKVK